jgi:hypothetical protein
MTAIKQFMVGSSKLCGKYSLRLLRRGLRIIGVAQLVRHEIGMRLPMSMPKQVYVQVADMLAMELLYPTWLVEHLRIRLRTPVMRLPSQRLSVISQKSGKLSHCVGWVSIRCWR